MFSLIKFSKPSNLNHFPFKISSVPEEVAFMEFVKFIPYLLCVRLSFLIFFLWKLSMILLKFLLKFFFHLLSELIENDFLFGSTSLIELNLSNLYKLIIFGLLKIRVFFHFNNLILSFVQNIKEKSTFNIIKLLINIILYKNTKLIYMS